MAHGYLRDWDENWSRGDERERSERDWRGRERDWIDRDRDRSSGFMLSDRDRSLRSFRSRQDDHYLSWRDRQMAALDRDYADYCAEREQQFHQDFDSWRNQRRGNHQPLQTGMTQTGQSKDPSGTLELTNEAGDNLETEPDSTAAATLGTTSGRGER